MQRGPIEQLKVAVIGDGTVGKTSLLYSFSSSVFPGEYMPTYDTDHFAAIVTFHGNHYRLLLWDSPGQDELFNPIRTLLLHQVDVILLCYAIDSASSIHNARYRWAPELKQLIPDVPMIIVGTKSDLRPPRKHLQPETSPGGGFAPIRLSRRTLGPPSPAKKSSSGKLTLSPSRSAPSPTHNHVQSPDALPASPKSLSPVSPTHSTGTTPNPMIIADHGHTNGDTPDMSSPAHKGPSLSVPIVEYTEGLQLAREIGASAYVECSALTRAGMEGVFQETCAAYCAKHDKLYKSGSSWHGFRWRSNIGLRMSSFRKHA